MDNSATQQPVAVPMIWEAINKVSAELAAPKDKTAMNRYKYRDLPTLRNNIKPLLIKHSLAYIPSAQKIKDGDRDVLIFKIHLVCYKDGSFADTEVHVNMDEHKGMSAEQASGSAMTYAEKYLLCALFHVDDDATADLDDPEVATADRQAYEDALQTAINRLKFANTNEELTDFMNDYKQFWKDPQFISEGQKIRARLTQHQQ